MSTANDIESTTTCPSCMGSKLAKNGKTPAGLQRFKCLDGRGVGCCRQFVAGSDYAVNPVILLIVKKLLYRDVPPPVIYWAVPGISRRWIYELRRRIK